MHRYSARQNRDNFSELLVNHTFITWVFARQRIPVNYPPQNTLLDLLVFVFDEGTRVRKPEGMMSQVGKKISKNGLHRKDDYSNAPAINQVVVSLVILLADDLWC